MSKIKSFPVANGTVIVTKKVKLKGLNLFYQVPMTFTGSESHEGCTVTVTYSSPSRKRRNEHFESFSQADADKLRAGLETEFGI